MPQTLPHTETRVNEKTAERINRRIRREMEARVLYYAQNPDGIDDRLQELAEEWDIERVVETHAAGVGIAGTVLAHRSRKWLMLPVAVAGFLMAYAIEGWYPALAIFRRLGIRTAKEINDERYALKVLRGDFDDVDVAHEDRPETKAQAALRTLDSNR